jgi:uncharacterized protein (DUF1015 family)
VPRVSPFLGLRYDERVVGPLERVTAPPYDVISEQRRRAFEDRSPYNIVRVDLGARLDGGGSTDRDRYAPAADLLSTWIERGVLVADDRPAYYGYEMSFPQAADVGRIRGLLCAVELEPWGTGVLPHEQTMEGPIEDRLALLRASRTHVSAIYATADGPIEPLDELLTEATSGAATAELVDEQFVRHRLWRVDGDPDAARWLRERPLMIADGHHRYVTALRYRTERDAGDGPGPWDGLLTLVVDGATEALPVLPFHRVQTSGPVPDTGEPVHDLEAARAALSDDGVTAALVFRGPDGGLAYRVLTLPGDPPTVRALHEQLLDQRVPAAAIEFEPDLGDAVRSVADGTAVAAYLLPPTTPSRIRSVVERGERLPRKSTYFWPKPRTGMILMPLDSPPPRPRPSPAS